MTGGEKRETSEVLPRDLPRRLGDRLRMLRNLSGRGMAATILRFNQAWLSPSPIRGDNTPLFQADRPGATAMPAGREYIRAWIVVLTMSPAIFSIPRSAAQEPASVRSPTAAEPAGGSEGSTDAPAPSAPPGRLGPGSQALEGSNVENYKLLRYDEDYSYLKDPSRRTDPLDVLKYIPLGDWGDDYYLSIGGTARPRFEFNQNPFFGTRPPILMGTTTTCFSDTCSTQTCTSDRTSAFSVSFRVASRTAWLGARRRTSTSIHSTPIKRSSTSCGVGEKKKKTR